MSLDIRTGHVLDLLRELEPESAQTCITSPPYWGLRDYATEPQVWGGEPGCVHEWGPERKGGEGYRGGGKRKWQHGATRESEPEKWAQGVSQGSFCQRCGAWLGHLGLEPAPELYVAHIVEIFREVRRVLKPDGVLFLNLGDCYAAGKQGRDDNSIKDRARLDAFGHGGGYKLQSHGNNGKSRKAPPGLKPKDLVGIPWRVAFALQADGWWLRSDIIWAKPNPMPESVTDRPTRSHEYVFLLTKGERYYYDAAAIMEAAVGVNAHDLTGPGYEAPGQTPQKGNRASWRGSTFDDGKTCEMKRTRGGKIKRDKQGQLGKRTYDGFNERWDEADADGLAPALRNKRDVWTIPVHPFPEAHFATFPPALAETCIRAGSRPGDMVLDPFLGAGTTGLMAHHLGRDFTGLELNPEYVEMAKRRISGPLFAGA